MQDQLRGVFSIPVTPFERGGALDEDAFQRCVAFCLDAGAHGIVAPVLAGEFTALADDERRRVAELTVETVAGRVPVVIGVSGVGAVHAVGFARHARAIGADAVIAMPPYVRKATLDETAEYYRAVADAAQLPIFIQNFQLPIGTPLPASLMARLVREIDGIEYIKEETVLAGRFLLDDYRRGACGTMPACEFTDVHVAIWEALEAGDVDRARALHARLLPLLNMEWLYGASLVKEVLRRRGILDQTATRSPGYPALDAFDHQELDALLADVGQLFTVAPLAELVRSGPAA